MSKLLIVEHKTSSENIGIGSVYWRKLTLDDQISGYMVGARSLGFEPDGVLYDVLRKPELEPYRATPIERREYTKPRDKACPECKRKLATPAPHVVDGLSCADGRIVTDPGGRLYANMRERDETVDEYRDRLLADIADRPEHYYQRGVVVRLEDEERDAAADTWVMADLIRLSRNAGRWPRNVDSCSQYNRMCDYWAVCSGETSIEDPLRFERGPLHPELEGKYALPLITASSAKCFRACARRYFFAYELGARPRIPAHALSFGRRIHLGLEAWLSSGRDLGRALDAMRTPVYDFDAAKAEAMMRGYHARWETEPVDVLAVEREFVSDLVNPETGAKSRTFVRAGRLDAIVRHHQI